MGPPEWPFMISPWILSHEPSSSGSTPEKRPFGVWDPEKYHSALTRECGQRYAYAVGEARYRQRIAGGALPPACAPVAAPRKARVPVLQPKYVHLPREERQALRQFEPVPEALPPFPCRLCDQNFATHATFMQHVHSAHTCSTIPGSEQDELLRLSNVRVFL